MRFVAKVIFVVGIIGFKAAEQSAYSCNDCYLTLEFSLTYILLFTDKLAACARWEQPRKPVIVAGYSAGMKVEADQGIDQRDESGETKDSACCAATKESGDTRDRQDAT